MPKTIKEFQLNQSTGEVSVEYSDDSTSKFNAADMVTAQTDPVTGGISYQSGLETHSVVNYGVQGIALIGSSTFANDCDPSTPVFYASGPVSNGLALAGWPIRSVKNYAVGGSDRTDLIRQFRLAIAENPAIIAIQPGSNDIANGATAVDVWGVVKPIVDAAISRSAIVALRATHPRGLTQAQNIEMVKLRSMMFDYARITRKVRVIDAWGVIVDPATGSARTGYLKSDNTHLSNLGAFVEGAEWAKLFSEIYGSIAAQPGDAAVAGTVAQRVANPMLTGTGGTAQTGISGIVPDGTTISRFSGTGAAVASIVSSGGKNKVRITTTGKAGDIFQIKFDVAAASAGFVNQDVFVTVDYVTYDGIGHQPKIDMAGTGKILQRDDNTSERKALAGANGKSQTFALFSRPVTEDGIFVFIYQIADGVMVVDAHSPSIVPAYF